MRLARVGLHGVFAVYKPPGVAWMAVRNSVETHLLRGEPWKRFGPVSLLHAVSRVPLLTMQYRVFRNKCALNQG